MTKTSDKLFSPRQQTVNQDLKPGKSRVLLHPKTKQKPPEQRDASSHYVHPLGTTALQERQEIGGPAGLEPTRFGDWERSGKCVDF